MRFETIPFAYRFRTPKDANDYAVTGDKSLAIMPVIAEQTEDGLVLRLNPEYITAPYEYALVFLHCSHNRAYTLPNHGFDFDDSVRVTPGTRRMSLADTVRKARGGPAPPMLQWGFA